MNKDEKLFLYKLNKIKNNLKIDYNEKTKKNKI